MSQSQTCKFRRVSEHVAELTPAAMGEFESAEEFLVIWMEAIRAHFAYYMAGFLHGNVCPETIMSFNGVDQDGKPITEGIMLDLDKCSVYEKYVRKPKVEKPEGGSPPVDVSAEKQGEKTEEKEK
ncbi:uncharacterized protein LAESUDRAFT_728665 [Laetiporus sulphureus 93-53]|uniref:Fungal-type protein kinase domain-containing protein n=1 Tax=Laetiporus sulphureus 93-53 TaxID=1314785 RepID=A0A165D1I1_9APHY|nr:uncharacterized protein LAESUDRAFT_728665 [Laetiporus sulphureus 93-53]KZT03958.1 hypothetical protein LAESUDRAFT_728665 [Laetiporus sulphureus 93-53]